MVCTFQKSCHLQKISNMLMGNIIIGCYNVMGPLQECLHIAKSLQDESDRGLISCIGNFFKPLDNIQRFSL